MNQVVAEYRPILNRITESARFTDIRPRVSVPEIIKLGQVNKEVLDAKTERNPWL